MLYRYGVMVVYSDMSTEIQIGKPYPTTLYFSTVGCSIYVYGTLVTYVCAIMQIYYPDRYGVMVADSDMPSET